MQPPPEESSPVPIGAAVDHLMRVRGLQATVVLADVLTGWEEIVGGDVAAHVVPVALRHGELVIEVDEPIWATQVQLLSSLLLGRLADRLGASAPTRLQVRVGRFPRPGEVPRRGSSSRPGTP